MEEEYKRGARSRHREKNLDSSLGLYTQARERATLLTSDRQAGRRRKAMTDI